MLSYVGANVHCRHPHRVLLAIQDLLIYRHVMLDTGSEELDENGRVFGSGVHVEVCDQIEEVLENAHKTETVKAKNSPDVLDPYSFGSGIGGRGWAGERGLVAESVGVEPGEIDDPEGTGGRVGAAWRRFSGDGGDDGIDRDGG